MNGSSRVVLEGQNIDPRTDDIKMKEVTCLGGILARSNRSNKYRMSDGPTWQIVHESSPSNSSFNHHDIRSAALLNIRKSTDVQRSKVDELGYRIKIRAGSCSPLKSTNVCITLFPGSMEVQSSSIREKHSVLVEFLMRIQKHSNTARSQETSARSIVAAQIESLNRC